jgi:glucose/mannose-6-phosphate isomerase
MSLLDDTRALAASDPGRMLRAALSLPDHCREGYRLGRGLRGLPAGDAVESIALCGMGGSGISGDIVRALYRDRLFLPVDVVRGPELPEFCGKDTLVVCSSYSGNTAETLTLFEEAARRGCRLVAVCSGGVMARRATELDVAVVPVPQGFMPRAALGYLLLGALGALEAMGVVPDLGEELAASVAALERLAGELGPDKDRSRNEAKGLAAACMGRFPVIWGAEGLGHVAATRWKTEINENGKVPAFASSLPELDHNEVVGWSDGMGEMFLVIALRHEGEHGDVADRFPVSLSIAGAAGALSEEVWATGETELARVLSLCMKGSATSVYLGIARGVDPGPVAAIERVKRELEGA